MTTMTIFITPNLIEKIEEKTDQLTRDWNIHKDEYWTVYQMVATIESGVETRLFYDGNGLVYDGWNGYKGMDNDNPDPSAAYGGFYRGDNRMIGWSIYMIVRAEVEDKQSQIARCWSAYSLDLVWEDENMVWGFYSYQDFYTADDQAAAAAKFEGQRHVKRVVLEEENQFSGMYRMVVETTRKKLGLKNEWKQRVVV